MKGRPDDWTHVVRAQWREVAAYIVSSAHPTCLKMAKDEVAFIRRNMRQVLLDRVPALEPGPHWFMAVVLCPGDALEPLVRWARGVDARRVHFYLHADAEARLLAPWRDAGLPLSRISQGFRAYGPLHQELGLDLSDQVYADFAP